ncbi:hypothetical protein [Methylobacterium phyllostachyos]|uniref:hypothetical protein n=1 Tax=Methylobacterium phyllostachyos TaxID=582672 RepID=UPI00115F7F02|nr:hypothetical protein [Methylobacterium phyllostachyos]
MTETDASPLAEDFKLEHFKSLFELARHYNDKLTEAFTFFIQTITVIIGGCFYLVLEKKIDTAHTREFILLSDAIVTLLTIITLCRIFGNLTAWYNIRKQQFENYHGVRPPRPFRSSVMECFMAAGVVAAWGVFLYANPFAILSPI